jgi:CxxC-x17-CxxC domain-containing protein
MAKLHGIMSEERKMYPMKCADCGTDSEVPFEPKPDRPVYCKECLPVYQNIDLAEKDFRLNLFKVFQS